MLPKYLALSLQGSFREHVLMLNKLPGVEGREVRTKEQLLAVDSLIIPGGRLCLGIHQEFWCSHGDSELASAMLHFDLFDGTL